MEIRTKALEDLSIKYKGATGEVQLNLKVSSTAWYKLDLHKTAKQKSSTSKRAQSASNMLDEVTKAQLDINAFDSGLSKGALYERAK